MIVRQEAISSPRAEQFPLDRLNKKADNKRSGRSESVEVGICEETVGNNLEIT
jgi:hypothetical protein